MKVGEIYRKKMSASVKDGVGKRSNTFVVSFHGVSSAKMDHLRKDLKRKKADMLVSKASVARIALKEAQYEELAKTLEGQMALVLSDADASEVSKVLVTFSKSYEGFVVRGGVLNGNILDQNEVKQLSDLPSREVLLATLLGTMQAPLTRFAGALNAKTRDLMSILTQLAKKNTD